MKKLGIALLWFCLITIALFGDSQPNTWASAVVKNDWGKPIFNITLNHRYDNDHFNTASWPALENGRTSEGLRVGYWTGFGRTGVDYWKITFEAEGKVWTCKDNFYCYLKKEDQDKIVICRVYKSGNEAKMDIQCPGSSSCTVSLDTKTAEPNTWANATVKNDLCFPIKNVRLDHRYDNDHYNSKTWNVLAAGASGDTFRVGYWTGFGRIGVDYWRISFEAYGKLWSCKDNFYCYLKKEDANKTVQCRVYLDGSKPKMDVICPGSSSCTVALDSSMSAPVTRVSVPDPNDYKKTIAALRAGTRPVRWNLDRQKTADRLLEIIETPQWINQGNLPLCGPAAFLYTFILRNKPMVASFAYSLFENGEASIGNYQVKPGDDLLNNFYECIQWKPAPHNKPCPPAEWYIMSALRDAENVLFDYEGTFSWDENAAAITTPADMIKWMTATGVYRSIKDETCPLTGYSREEAAKAVAHAEQFPPGAARDVIMMANINMFASAADKVGGLDARILEHWVVLQAPLKVIRQGDKIVSVDIPCFTWGGNQLFMNISGEDFAVNYYGVISAEVKESTIPVIQQTQAPLILKKTQQPLQLKKTQKLK